MSERRAKYGNRRVEVAPGLWCDSLKESARWFDLRCLEGLGEITGLVFHPRWRLVVNGVRISTFTADSAYTIVATGQRVVEDVKSEPTRQDRAYKLRKKLMHALYDIEVQEWL